MKRTFLTAMALLLVLACKKGKDGETENKTMDERSTMAQGTFGYDVDFLKTWDPELIVLESGDASVAVSGHYQAKVFTSSVAGEKGRSLGWINYGAFGKSDPHMNAFGGESRFWLGPEGNAFSLFFAPGKEMVFENWKTPAPIDSEAWEIGHRDSSSVLMEHDMEIRNHAGHSFQIKAQREVRILSQGQIQTLLGITTEGVQGVGYETVNTIANAGDFAWTRETGAPCIWILDMFPPSDDTTIFIPYDESAPGPVATTDYFGQIPEDRVGHKDGMLYFKADGKSRGKLGLSPLRAKPLAGSYDAQNKILTLALFDVDREGIYLNQAWNLKEEPFLGDAMNAYNDGPLDDGSQMGPFYELESVSPAAFLNPGESLSHRHTVIHFSGDTEALDQIVEKLFGSSLERITNFL